MNSPSTTLTIKPGGILRGRIRVPGDKSISHRAIMLGAIAEGTTEISGFLEGEDTLATLSAFRAMGVEIERPELGAVTIHGVGLDGLKPPSQPLDLGNSGTSMRLMAGLLAGQRFDSQLTGDPSLSKRPMRRVIEPLSKMGARIECTQEGTAPLRIQGGRSLNGIHYEMPVASAQVKSCLLLAGLYADGRTCVEESTRTRDHTERMLACFGYPIEKRRGRVCVEGGHALHGLPIQVPADLSSAAFFLVGAAIAPGSEVILEHVGINPTRTGVIDILKMMGAKIEILNPREEGGEPVAELWVRGSRLKGIAIPPELVPLAIDEFPALFIAAACAEGETVLTGAEELRYKESNRIEAMAEGLQSLGIAALPTADGMVIQGGSIQGGCIDSRGDHRIAMAFAMAGLRAGAPIVIHDCANINTSFPGFADLARQAGLNIMAKEHVPVIAVDGPSGTGKGTLCLSLARRLGWHFLDSGALYRVLAFAALQAGLDLSDEPALEECAQDLPVVFDYGNSETAEVRILLNDRDVTEAIRTEVCGNAASRVAALPGVRRALLSRQQAFRQLPGLVADGRDMGTVVFPDADLKIFLEASQEERASRRYKQLKEKGLSVNLPQLLRDIAERDARDSERSVAPLKAASDAVIMDTTAMGVSPVFERVMELAKARVLIH